MSEYPTESELKKIRNWEGDLLDLAHYVISLWSYPDRAKLYKGKDFFGKSIKKLYLSTGGWSGNEGIMGALQRNFMFWSLCWVQSKRGGHYWFEFRRELSEM